MMKIGLIGLGHLGKIHLKCIKQIPQWDIVGYYDADSTLEIEGISKFESARSLMLACDAIDIIASTQSHFDLMAEALELDKHIFVEKPMCSTFDQAARISDLAQDKSCIVQVGHVERYNPAMISIKDERLQPVFIEVDRLAPFNMRGTDVSVIMDLMIHDLDIILDLVKSEVIKVDANAIAILSQAADICNARIEFANGCVANVTASRISMKQMRKIRIVQTDAYISLDFLEKQSQIIRLVEYRPGQEKINGIEIETPKGKKMVQIQEPATKDSNAIKNELEDFYHSIVSGEPPMVGIKEASAAINLAERITQSALKNVKKLENNGTEK